MERGGGSARRDTSFLRITQLVPPLSIFVLVSQVPGEANPINMVAKLSQLTSLLSSIEDKVLQEVLKLW